MDEEKILYLLQRRYFTVVRRYFTDSQIDINFFGVKKCEGFTLKNPIIINYYIWLIDARSLMQGNM